MTENGKQNFNENKKKKALKIGVIGNNSTGKTFILSRISKIKLPTIKTEGLCIKYPELNENKNKNIVLIDYGGFDNPILNEKNNLEIEDLSDKEKNDMKEKIREQLFTEFFYKII